MLMILDIFLHQKCFAARCFKLRLHASHFPFVYPTPRITCRRRRAKLAVAGPGACDCYVALALLFPSIISRQMPSHYNKVLVSIHRLDYLAPSGVRRTPGHSLPITSYSRGYAVHPDTLGSSQATMRCTNFPVTVDGCRSRT